MDCPTPNESCIFMEIEKQMNKKLSEYAKGAEQKNDEQR